MDVLKEQFVWSERFRPQTIDECILPDRLKAPFRDYVKQGEIPHLLLTGTAGVGKTTLAKALCDELKSDFLVINASLDNGIDLLRTRITNFASSVSMLDGNNKAKVVILDEADHLNPASTQPAMRGFMQDYAQNCRFIFTCNFKNKIIAPLHSRMNVIEFKLKKGEKVEMATLFMKRVEEILKLEKVTYDKKVVAQLVMKFFPDYRSILNALQHYSTSGSIDEGILLSLDELSITPLVAALRAKDFKKMRAWVVSNSDQDIATIFRAIYDTLLEEVKQVPQLVLLLADYQYKSAFAVDQEVNLVACLTEIMAAVDFKS
jgi:DNA polymerase III delta prime subunit